MAVPDEIPQGSIEFLAVILESPDDLTLGTVELGLSSDAVDQPTAWLPGTWPTPGPSATGEYEARTVSTVNTGALAKGHYKVWAKLTDSPEILPRPYGIVRVV